jgi:hypothetical protein
LIEAEETKTRSIEAVAIDRNHDNKRRFCRFGISHWTRPCRKWRGYIGTTNRSPEHHYRQKRVTRSLSLQNCFPDYSLTVCDSLGHLRLRLHHTKGGEQFAKQFHSYAAKVLDAVDNSIDRTLIPMDSLAVDLVSYAHATNSLWPFVTLPDFPLRLAKALPLTDALLLTFIPIVQPHRRKEWELYASQNDGWVNQTQQLQETWDDYYGSVTYNWNSSYTIFTDQGDLEANVR